MSENCESVLREGEGPTRRPVAKDVDMGGEIVSVDVVD